MPEFPEMVGHILGFTAPMRFVFRVVRGFFSNKGLVEAVQNPAKRRLWKKHTTPWPSVSLSVIQGLD